MQTNIAEKEWGQFSFKVIRMFAQALEKYPSAEFFIKVDDDTAFFPRNFFATLATFIEKRNSSTGIYLGRPWSMDIPKYNANKSNETYAGPPLKHHQWLAFAMGGAGYVVSRDGAQAIARCEGKMHTFPDTWSFQNGEDRVVAVCLFRSGIYMSPESFNFVHSMPLSKVTQMPRAKRLQIDKMFTITAARYPLTIHPLKSAKMLERAYNSIAHHQVGACEGRNLSLEQWGGTQAKWPDLKQVVKEEL